MLLRRAFYYVEKEKKMSEQKYTDEEWKKIQEFIESSYVQNFLNGKGYYPNGLMLPPSLMGVIPKEKMDEIVFEYDKLRREQKNPFKTTENIFDVLRERIEGKEPDSKDGKGGNKVEITKKFLEEPNLKDGKGGNKIDGNKIDGKVGKNPLKISWKDVEEIRKKIIKEQEERIIKEQRRKIIKEQEKKIEDLLKLPGIKLPGFLKKMKVPEEAKTTEQNKDRNKDVNNTYVQNLRDNTK